MNIRFRNSWLTLIFFMKIVLQCINFKLNVQKRRYNYLTFSEKTTKFSTHCISISLNE